MACKADAIVRHVRCDVTGTYFVCEHCSAEHLVHVPDVPPDEPARFEIVRLRSKAGDGADSVDGTT